jgi:AcrR family transcriptional regulator
MTPRPRADRAAKRAELTAVAATVFAERGVANTAVSDIVRAAGVAQGTFYLYFDSKDDAVLAVVERMVVDLSAAIEAAADVPGASAVERFIGLRDALRGFEHDPSAVELAGFLHRPENQALHDRLTERLAQRLVVIVEEIVAQGVDEGAFDVPDIKAAAWFVLGGLQSIERAETSAAEMPHAITAVTVLALRALGYQGELS